MTFANLVAPLTPDQFLSDYWGQRPVHLPAQAGVARPGRLGWDRLNDLLQQRAHWDADSLKLVMNSRAVAAEHYVDALPGYGTTRHLANPAKVEALLAMGASMVGNEVQDAAPEVRAATDMLGRMFAARAWGNLYASFKGVQAFASHCDTHEVFAVQCEGEKRWRLYTNRAENPTETLEGPEAQAQIDAAKGPVTMDIVLRPGDVLYIPRGWFHDAIATAEASLHLTIGILPMTGQGLFRLLETAAGTDAAFRAYLPDARTGGGAALAERMSALAERLVAIMRTPAFVEDVSVMQRRSVDPGYGTQLPARPTLRFYARTDRQFSIVATETGHALRTQAGHHDLNGLREVAEWMLSRPAFSTHEVAARFLHQDRAGIDALVAATERMGLVQHYRPEMG